MPPDIAALRVAGSAIGLLGCALLVRFAIDQIKHRGSYYPPPGAQHFLPAMFTIIIGIALWGISGAFPSR